MTDEEKYPWYTDAAARRDHHRDVVSRAQQPDQFADIPTEELELLAIQSLLPSDDPAARDAIIADTAQQWVAATPAYSANEKNGKMIELQLHAMGADLTDPRAYDRAFVQLAQAGLIEVNKEAVEEYDQEVRREARRQRVGMSAKRSLEPPRPADPDFDRMSMSDLEAFVLRKMMAGEQ